MNKILLIDDDKELCALIKKSVLQESIEADCCYLGRDGLIKLKENKYQLVITDIMMPEFDGFEILEQLGRKIIYLFLCLHQKMIVFPKCADCELEQMII